MNLQLPRNAWEVVKARQNGLKPAGPLIVVMTERYHQLPDDAHVYADGGKAYRWDFVKGLDVVVAIDASIKLGNLLADINFHEPAQIDVIDVERELGWLVLSANPNRLKTSKWPKYWVQKWLTLECGPVAFSSV